jgi:hypothetical protein
MPGWLTIISTSGFIGWFLVRSGAALDRTVAAVTRLR